MFLLSMDLVELWSFWRRDERTDTRGAFQRSLPAPVRSGAPFCCCSWRGAAQWTSRSFHRHQDGNMQRFLWILALLGHSLLNFGTNAFALQAGALSRAFGARRLSLVPLAEKTPNSSETPATNRHEGLSRQMLLKNAAGASLAAFLAMESRGEASAAGLVELKSWVVNDIDIPPLDERAYRAIGLPNGLRVLLVSDPSTETAAAAMNVHVGHFSDPPDIPGLAHFCEHMLFLGTSKYPNEDDFNSFLASHGGNSNAFTASEDTNYYFDVAPESLKDGLDRFAWFFIEPLFTDSATTREVNAIDSEHGKNLQSDVFRLYQLSKSRANVEHPFHKFGTGNRLTLKPGQSLRLALRGFHKQYYRADAMTLCVYGKESLKALETMVRKLFTDVPSSAEAPASDWGPKSTKWCSLPAEWAGVTPFLTPSASGDLNAPVLEYQVVPVGGLRRLSVEWPVPYKSSDEKGRRAILKPEYFISWLLGHEGVGSLTELLKKEGLINALAADISEETEDFQTLNFVVDLTDAGLQTLGRQRILEALFKYLHTLRRKGLPPYIVGECRLLNDLAWKYLDRSDSTSYTSALAGNMQKFPVERVVSGAARLGNEQDVGKFLIDESGETTSDLVCELLDQLTPTNALFTTVASEKELSLLNETKGDWEVEPIYGTKFKRRQMPAEFVSSLAEPESPVKFTGGKLDLPLPNPYLPNDLKLKTPPETRKRRPGDAVPGPTQLGTLAEDTWRTFFKQDRTFQRPRAQIIFNIATPTPEQSPRDYVRSKLFSFLFEEEIGAQSYPALLAGISGSVDLNARGMRISFGGYNDKMNEYAKFYATSLASYSGPKADSFSSAEEKFLKAKDVVRRELRSWTSQQPYIHAAYEISVATEAPRFQVVDIASALEEVSLDDIRTFAERDLWTGKPGNALLQGNLLESEAMEYVQLMDEALKPKLDKGGPSQVDPTSLNAPRVRQKLVPVSTHGQGVVLRRREPNFGNDNSAAYVSFQVPNPDDEQRAAIDLLAAVLEEPFYDDLRTRQQLGYLTFSGAKQKEKSSALVCIVQSTDRDPVYLTERIFDFVDNARPQILNGLSDERWLEYASSLAQKKLNVDKQLAQELNRHWTEIETGALRWNRKLDEARALSVANKDKVLQFFDDVVGSGGSRRRVLVSQVFCEKHAGTMDRPVPDGSTLVEESMEFKQTLPFIDES